MYVFRNKICLSMSDNVIDPPRANDAQGSRDKFKLFDGPEMPPAIPAWVAALARVTKTDVPSMERVRFQYIFPEPALLVSSPDESRRQLYLHHYTMIHDALLYRLGDTSDSRRALSSQEWRDVLAGKVHAQGSGKSATRSAAINEILGPALRACGMHQYYDFPADPKTIPAITKNRAREIVWEVAESGFRFEFLSLDRQASRMSRPDECRECFAGGMLMGMPIGMSKQGLAAGSPSERLPYLLRIARLMRDWPRPPASITEARHREEWSDDQCRGLEAAVATYYTQTFYNFFSRAAIIPMRLEHEFGA